MSTVSENVTRSIKEELTRANGIQPVFHSDLEGIAFIRMRLTKSVEETKAAIVALKDLENKMFNGGTRKDRDACAKSGMIAARFAAEENIRLAVMFEKFTNREKPSGFMNMPQEELNKYVDRNYTGENDTTIIIIENKKEDGNEHK